MKRLIRLLRAIQTAWPNPPVLYRIPESYMPNPHPDAKFTILSAQDVNEQPERYLAPWKRAAQDGALQKIR